MPFTRLKRKRFSPAQYESVLARQDYICACGCGEPIVVGDHHFDHEIPLWLDGPDTLENLRALKRKHHLVKTAAEAGIRAKCDRQRAKHFGPQLNARDREIQRIRERRA